MLRPGAYSVAAVGFVLFAILGAFGLRGWLQRPEPKQAEKPPVEVAAGPVEPPPEPDWDKVRNAFWAAAEFVPFADLSHYVDKAKVRDGRWVFKQLDAPADPVQGLMLVADFPSGNATDPAPSIQVRIAKCLQKGNGTEYTREFKWWGKSVRMSQVELLAEGYYEDWIRGCSEPLKDKSKVPRKKQVGVAKYWGCAVGTDREDKKRVRMDWYVWTNTTTAGTYTWTAEAKTTAKFIDVPEWHEKVESLIKGIKPIPDSRAGK